MTREVFEFNLGRLKRKYGAENFDVEFAKLLAKETRDLSDSR